MIDTNFITIYGTEIQSDIFFPLFFATDTEIRYRIKLLSSIPKKIKTLITCGSPLYSAHGRKVYLYSNTPFKKSSKGKPWCYEVKDIVTFYWIDSENIIYYKLGKEGNDKLLSFWFIHLFFPFYMTLENKYDFFHAGAVESNGKAIFFIAPSMGGKSTLTDYFIKKGHALLSDDKVGTFIKDNKFIAVGAHSYHRPYRKFEDLGFYVKNFSKNFKPIKYFYVLKKVAKDENIEIEEVKGFDKFDKLLPHYLYMFSWLKKERLIYLTKMLNNIAIFEVSIPWDKERLNEVYIAINKHKV